VFVILNLNGDRGLNVAELRSFAEARIVHDADTNASGQFDLSELLRVIQFFNAGGVYCSEELGDTVDGFQVSEGGQNCPPYAVDLLDQDWVISLSELLRVIQLFNIGPYEICEEQPDGVCPV